MTSDSYPSGEWGSFNLISYTQHSVGFRKDFRSVAGPYKSEKLDYPVGPLDTLGNTMQKGSSCDSASSDALAVFEFQDKPCRNETCCGLHLTDLTDLHAFRLLMYSEDVQICDGQPSGGAPHPPSLDTGDVPRNNMNRHHPYGGYQDRGGPRRGLNFTPSRGHNRTAPTHGGVLVMGGQPVVVRAASPPMNITSNVIDCHGQTQALLACSASGVWSIHPKTLEPPFTVKFDDPSFRRILASKYPWEHIEWNTPARINILLELLYWEFRLSTADDYKFKLFKCTRRIAQKFEILPSSLYIRGLTKEGDHPIWGGGYADIWKGQASNGDPVCLKVLRVFATEASKKHLFKEFSQEALVWSQLSHPNVLPFLGTNMDLFPSSYCLVSPWCTNGNVMIYLSTHPEANKMGIVSDILKGLEYLHARNPPVVHGDLKGANILVSDSGQCRLADFGLAVMMSTLQTLSSSTGNGTRGSVRWMAPELFDFTTNSRPSTVTDMYSFGCTVFEIVTGSPPFSDMKLDIAVSIQVMSGSRPPRPVGMFPDGLWTAVEKCWVQPSRRHSAKTFRDEMVAAMRAESDDKILGISPSFLLDQRQEYERVSSAPPVGAHGEAVIDQLAVSVDSSALLETSVNTDPQGQYPDISYAPSLIQTSKSKAYSHLSQDHDSSSSSYIDNYLFPVQGIDSMLALDHGVRDVIQVPTLWQQGVEYVVCV